MMTDDLHLGFDQLPGVDLGSLQPQQAAPDRPNSTDADLSFIPEARTTSKGPEAWPEPTHPLRDLLWKHTGPQEAPKPDDTDITGSMAGAPIKPEAPPPTAAPGSTAPDAAGLPTQAPPAPQRPLSADEQMQEWLHPTTELGKQQASDWDAVFAAGRAAWENDLGTFQDVLEAHQMLVANQQALAEATSEQARRLADLTLLTGIDTLAPDENASKARPDTHPFAP